MYDTEFCMYLHAPKANTHIAAMLAACYKVYYTITCRRDNWLILHRLHIPRSQIAVMCRPPSAFGCRAKTWVTF